MIIYIDKYRGQDGYFNPSLKYLFGYFSIQILQFINIDYEIEIITREFQGGEELHLWRNCWINQQKFNRSDRKNQIFVRCMVGFIKTSNRTFTYRLFLEDFIYVVKINGVRNLWRGNSMNIYRMFPHAAIDFATFDYLRGKFYKKDKSFKQKVILFLCGSMAGMCALTVTDPLQFVRIRLAMQKSAFTYRNSLHAFTHIYQNEGFFGFYKGYIAAMIGVIIYQGISFSLFTRSKQKIKELDASKFNRWYVDFILGGLSAVGQIVAYPLDILRKRMQGQSLLLQKGQIKYKQNYKQLIKYIYETQRGIKGFYKGVTLNLIKAPLASATAWTIKNFINRKLNRFYDF